VTVVGDDVGYTVDLEHMTRHAGDHPQPRTLRCTRVYRREDGEWKVVPRKSRVTWRSDNTWGSVALMYDRDRTNHVQTFCLRY
jgi:ketosteroid isomerase-like protein